MASTCGYDSDGAARVAATGYDCTVLPAHNIWGFCPTTVIAASDCGLFGYCYDSGSCSTGCGPFPSSSSITYLTVITCAASQTCSFLNSDNGGGQVYSNIQCGNAGGTQTLYPTPPKVLASTTSSVAQSAVRISMTTTSPVSTSSTSPSTSDGSSAISDSQVSTTNLAGIASQTSSVGTLAATSPYTSVAGDATSNDTNHSSPPYGAIIGGALGGVALLCLTVLAVFLIRRKNASSAHGPPSYPTAVAQAQDSYYANGLSSGKWYDHPYQKPQEISNDTAIYEAEANMDPAELPGR